MTTTTPPGPSCKRGDVALALFPDSNLRTAKLRPVLVVQADGLGLSQVIVAMTRLAPGIEQRDDIHLIVFSSSTCPSIVWSSLEVRWTLDRRWQSVPLNRGSRLRRKGGSHSQPRAGSYLRRAEPPSLG